MRVVHLNTYDSGGAAIAAIRLHQALLSSGVESDIVFRYTDGKVERGHSILGYSTFWHKLSHKLGFSLSWNGMLRAVLNKIYTKKTEVFTYPFSSFRIEEHPLIKQADIVHLHWVGDFVDFRTFFKRLKKPIVWTVHDKNPFLGLCHLENDVQRNGIHRLFQFTEKRLCSIKQKYLNRIPINFVSPSLGLMQFGEKVLNKHSFVQIPNLLSSGYEQKLSRVNHTHKNERFTLGLFGFPVTQWHKGGDLIPDLIKQLTERGIRCSIMGGEKPAFLENNPLLKWQVSSYSDEVVHKFYEGIDALVITSIEENLPNVMLEAFANGIPVVSFPIGGMNQYVLNDFTGKKANSIGLSELVEAIIELSATFNLYNGETIKDFANKNFSKTAVVKQYLDLYQKILKGDTNG